MLVWDCSEDELNHCQLFSFDLFSVNKDLRVCFAPVEKEKGFLKRVSLIQFAFFSGLNPDAGCFSCNKSRTMSVSALDENQLTGNGLNVSLCLGIDREGQRVQELKNSGQSKSNNLRVRVL